MTGSLLVRVACRLFRAAWVLGGSLLLLPWARGGIDELRATALPPQPAFEQSVLGGELIGAHAGYFKFVPTRGEPRNLVPVIARWVEMQQEPTGLDLWNVAAATGAQPGSALVVAFDLERTAAGTEYLLFGCGGEAAVLVNDRPVFAFLGGSRSLLRNQDVVELPLVAGRNTVQVVFDRGAWDKIPIDHYAPEWAATLELAKDADAAWTAHAAQVIHPVFDPVVASYDALRVEAAVPGHEAVQLFDLNGALRAKGAVNRDLTIRWGCPKRR